MILESIIGLVLNYLSLFLTFFMFYYIFSILFGGRSFSLPLRFFIVILIFQLSLAILLSILQSSATVKVCQLVEIDLNKCEYNIQNNSLILKTTVQIPKFDLLNKKDKSHNFVIKKEIILYSRQWDSSFVEFFIPKKVFNNENLFLLSSNKILIQQELLGLENKFLPNENKQD